MLFYSLEKKRGTRRYTSYHKRKWRGSDAKRAIKHKNDLRIYSCVNSGARAQVSRVRAQFVRK